MIQCKLVAAWDTRSKRTYENYNQTCVQFFFVFAVGFVLLFRLVEDEIRPRYLEALEESLNDTAHLLAALVEQQASSVPNTTSLRLVMNDARKREFTARIYQIKKHRVNVKAYVTDAKGTVIYDSEGKAEGQDYSQWNDVNRTLNRKYGVRATRVNKEDPTTGHLYVAAPVYKNGRIIGVITVIKPSDSIAPFVEIAQRKLLLAAGFAGLAVLVLAASSFFWIIRPIRLLTMYVSDLEKRKRVSQPDVGGGEIGELGAAFERMRQELDGKHYVEQYIKTLSHEIKSPLSSIRAGAEILRENPESAQKEQFLANIVSETERIENLARRLLELSSIEGKGAIDRKETLFAHSVIEEAVERCQSLFTRKSQRIEVLCNQAIQIQAERYLIESAFVNLLENASAFSPEGSVITLTATLAGDKFICTIADQGPGIPEYALGRIFERFYSLPRPDSGRKSTGLGLCFVKEIAELHGGSVQLTNGKVGAVSVFEIPAR
ncbi:MAG: two-component system sensor histidine kinase CreC [Spirochaetia bacterium]|nr:two-component system sensor histidine kinase CreC [Spirochaetia bacterium]